MGNAYWQDQASPAFWGDGNDKQKSKSNGSTYKNDGGDNGDKKIEDENYLGKDG